MVAKKVAQSAAEPSTFDVDGFISGFKPALVSAKLHKRGDLIPKLSDLLARLQALKDEDTANIERSFADGDPLTELAGEYNAMQAEFEAGGYDEFLFKPMTTKLNSKLVVAHEKSPHKDDNEYLTWRAMSATCVSQDEQGHVTPRNIPMEAWPKLRDHVGDIAFTPVVSAFMDAFAGGGVTAPFSQFALPIPTVEAQLPDSGQPEISDTPL